MAVTLGFHGAARSVTGSRHLLTLGERRILVDCGLFQGDRSLRQRNWEPFPVEPREIDVVVLTHAHMDHAGWLPRLVKEGFTGKVLCTRATLGLARVSLPDSGRLQEEEADDVNRRGGSRHQPARPLYTERDAYAALKHFEAVPYREWLPLPGKAQFRFVPSGHILGSAMAEIALPNGERLLMSGDLGRFDAPIIRDPEPIDGAEYLVLESTYGDRDHPTEDPMEKLEAVLADAVARGAAVLVPSFAIGRTQELLYYLRRLQDAGRMPRLPVYIDSPMAVSATQLYQESREEHDEDMLASVAAGRSELEPEGVRYVRDREGSKALNAMPGPLMIIAGSGMANGGRILHHLTHRLEDPSTTVLFTGFQAEGTLGRRLLDGAEEVRIMKRELRVAARIERMHALSAHADRGEMLRWMRGFAQAPRRTFLVHGEPDVQDAWAKTIEAELGWSVHVPEPGETVNL